MKYSLLSLALFFGIQGFAQDLTCADLKEGTFTTTTEEPVKLTFTIERKGTQQIETIEEIPQEYIDLGYPTTPNHIIVQWIDTCSYRALYDESKGPLTESQQYINNLGGILTEITKIKGSCFYYKSTLKVNDQEQVMEGKMCKQ